jgi:hypothetical protein
MANDYESAEERYAIQEHNGLVASSSYKMPKYGRVYSLAIRHPPSAFGFREGGELWLRIMNPPRRGNSPKKRLPGIASLSPFIYLKQAAQIQQTVSMRMLQQTMLDSRRMIKHRPQYFMETN